MNVVGSCSLSFILLVPAHTFSCVQVDLAFTNFSVGLQHSSVRAFWSAQLKQQLLQSSNFGHSIRQPPAQALHRLQYIQTLFDQEGLHSV